MSRSSVSDMLSKIDQKAPALSMLEKYYAGRQPLAYLTSEAREAIGTRFDRLAVNVPRLLVSAISERLTVSGFDVGGTRSDQLWNLWTGSDLDQLAAQAHREALVLGSAYALVWADRYGRPRVTIESPHSMAVARDPATGEVVGAAKRWIEPTPDGRSEQAHVVVYRDTEIVHMIGEPLNPEKLTAVRSVPNDLGVVPVVPLVNADRPGVVDGTSEFADVIGPVDALNKILADMMVTSESYARPRRWATGLEVAEDDEGNPINPIPESDKTMISEAPETKFGQLSGAGLDSYRTAVDVIVQSISAVTGLPGHYLGVMTANPASAEQTRAAEAALTAKAEARQQAFGRSWEQVGRLMLAVADGHDPEVYDVRVRWADPSARSVAAEADATVKLHNDGVIDDDEARERAGVA